MLKPYKKQLIFASLVTLLPLALGLILRTAAPQIWYIGMGTPAPLPTMLLWMPLLLTALLWIGAWFTVRDNPDKNRKVFSLVLWIIPVISNLAIAVGFSLVLGADFSVTRIMLIALGLLFTVIGNFLPKCRQNRTIGIKVVWTLASRENWNATHRFAGPVWMLGGILMMLCACLPLKIGISLFLLDLIIFVLIPILYSYRYYQKQCRTGNAPDLGTAATKRTKGGLIAVAAVLFFVGIILFTGNVDYTFQEDRFTIESTFDADMVVYYDTIEAVEYRETEDRGVRAFGFGSPRLLLGIFENDEFGRYSRYSYTACPSAVVLTLANNARLVLNGNNEAETRALYEELTARVGQ